MTREPITFKTDIATKRIRVPSKWAMFTGKGNAAVKEIATDLATCVVSKYSTESRLNCFKKFTDERNRLGRIKGTTEITDTAVNEVMMDFLTDLAVETNVDPRAAAGIFYGEGKPIEVWNCGNVKMKEKYWWTCNPKPRN